jgi:probable phosphoglycerate mutase
MQNIYVVTHAQSIHHIQGLGGGWYDTSLTEKGVKQAETLADFLYGEIGIPGSVYL